MQSRSHKDHVKIVIIKLLDVFPSSTNILSFKTKKSTSKYSPLRLNAQELGDAFRKLAESSHESRAEKVADYTLSSCLTEDMSSIELPREVASALVFGELFVQIFEGVIFFWQNVSLDFCVGEIGWEFWS